MDDSHLLPRMMWDDKEPLLIASFVMLWQLGGMNRTESSRNHEFLSVCSVWIRIDRSGRTTCRRMTEDSLCAANIVFETSAQTVTVEFGVEKELSVDQ